MLTRKLTYFLLIAFFFHACKITKHVPEGKYLLQKNKITIKGDKLSHSELQSVLKQKPNFKSLVGLKFKLLAYNMVDSTKVAHKRARKNFKIRKINAKRLARQNRINNRRIEKARAKHKEVYTQKIIPLKDTLDPSLFLREWLKYKFGEPPVVFDSSLYLKSIKQVQTYMKSKGYYDADVKEELIVKEKKRKVIPHFFIETGRPYIIDTVFASSENKTVLGTYQQFLTRHKDDHLENKKFDSDLLDEFRSKVAKFMRDNALYGFSPNHIEYIADTILGNHRVALEIKFKPRLIPVPGVADSVIEQPHQITYLNEVYFHISDTTFYEGSFSAKMKELGIRLVNGQSIQTLDTLHYQEIRNKQGELIPQRTAIFMYNTKLIVKAKVLEEQNFLEKDNYYKEYYLDRTYTRLLQLGVFQTIKPMFVEIPGTNRVDIHYYLEPAPRRTLFAEPQATNSNGYLGVSATIKYINKNLFLGAEKFSVSLSGGFESSPPIFGQQDGQEIRKETRSFNTFEFGPTIKYELPKLTPFGKIQLSKRHRPRTIMSLGYNFQKRPDFKRSMIQMSYTYRFNVDKTQTFEFGLPFASVVSYVKIDKTDDFDSKINNLNDLFLRNSYSNQFIWQDAKLGFQYNNKDKDGKVSKDLFYYRLSLDFAGNVLGMFKSVQDTNVNGQRTFLKLPYSQFFKLDNEMIYSYPFSIDNSIHFRGLAGLGKPYGNSKTSLPYDYSFFAGGANDNRGWRSRTLGPGSYQKDLDSNRTITQIGDIRFGASVEYRIKIGGIFRWAFFADAGNIWLINEDVNRPGAKFSKNWYKEIAFSAGMGLRIDFSFFVVRLDAGIPIYNPALPNANRWVFNPQGSYHDQLKSIWGGDWKYYKGFRPVFHFGIGYPF